MEEKREYLSIELEYLIVSQLNDMFQDLEGKRLRVAGDDLVISNEWLRAVITPFKDPLVWKQVVEVAESGGGLPSARFESNKPYHDFEGVHEAFTCLIEITFPEELIRRLPWLNGIANRFYFHENTYGLFVLEDSRGTVGDDEDETTPPRIQ